MADMTAQPGLGQRQWLRVHSSRVSVPQLEKVQPFLFGEQGKTPGNASNTCQFCAYACMLDDSCNSA